MKQKEANMKKRALTLFLALVMVLSMAACGGTTESVPPESTAPESSAPESEAPAEPAEVVATPILDVVTETVTVDPANPLGSELAGGLYTVDLDGGRVLYHYVPETIGYRQPAVAIGVPSDSAADQFIADTGWQAAMPPTRAPMPMLSTATWTDATTSRCRMPHTTWSATETPRTWL